MTEQEKHALTQPQFCFLRHPLTLQLLDDALQQKYLDLKPFNVGLGLMSMSRLKKGYDWGFLATCLVDKATTEGKYYSLDSISLVVCGASRLIRYCPTLKTRVTPLLTSLGRRIGELAPHLTPSIVTVAVYGYAKVSSTQKNWCFIEERA